MTDRGRHFASNHGVSGQSALLTFSFLLASLEDLDLDRLTFTGDVSIM